MLNLVIFVMWDIRRIRYLPVSACNAFSFARWRSVSFSPTVARLRPLSLGQNACNVLNILLIHSIVSRKLYWLLQYINSTIWNFTITNLNKIQRIQNTLARVILQTNAQKITLAGQNKPPLATKLYLHNFTIVFYCFRLTFYSAC